MNILAIDLGTKTGFAYNDGDDLQLGTVVLATEGELKAARKSRLDRRLDMRVTRLYDRLLPLTIGVCFRFVVFEDVQFSTFTAQTQLWSSLRAALWLAVRHDSAIECVPVTTLKRFTTGRGDSIKPVMAKWLVRLHPERLAFRGDDVVDVKTGQVYDDNALDAFAVWRWAQHQFSRTP